MIHFVPLLSKPYHLTSLKVKTYHIALWVKYHDDDMQWPVLEENISKFSPVPEGRSPLEGEIDVPFRTQEELLWYIYIPSYS